MLERLRRTKLMYSIYNFFHRSQLSHNESVFKKIGLNKKYYSSISSKDFLHLAPQGLNTIIDKKPLLEKCSLYHKLSEDDRQSLLNFDNQGYALLKNYVASEYVDQVNEQIESLVAQQKIKFTYGKKLMFAIHKSPVINQVGNNTELKEILSVLIGGEAKLFQSINFLMGSEQATHSDSFHMTTYPVGGLLGVWIALEDIYEDNGPLHYYPKSHKLPYYMNKDYDNEGSDFFLGDKSYKAYEEMIRTKIKEQPLEKVKFLAKKGDLFIWHANLFHGGEPHLNKQKTRKSMVFHYFKKGCICYHEITQRPALIKEAF